MTRNVALMPSPDSVAALTVLFGNAAESIQRTVEAFDNTVRVARAAGRCHRFVLAFGDASPEPLFSDADVARWQAAAPHLDEVRYTFFDENTGTSRGQNLLAAQTESDAVLLCNPDIQPDGRALTWLLEALDDERVGLVEARQLPVEHPRATTTAAADVLGLGRLLAWCPRELFTRLGRVRREDVLPLLRRRRPVVAHSGGGVRRDPPTGRRRVPRQGAVDQRRLDPHRGRALLLRRGHPAAGAQVVARRPRRVRPRRACRRRPRTCTPEAVAEFRRRDAAGSLVARHDPGHDVAEFVDGNYAVHRYAL